MKTKFERQVSTVEHVTSCYEQGPLLGDGNFAVVKECRHRETGREYAMKVIDKAKLANKVSCTSSWLEISSVSREYRPAVPVSTPASHLMNALPLLTEPCSCMPASSC